MANFFGGYDTYVVISASPFKSAVNVIVASLATGNYWQEELALKSDITRLEQKIADLKKQIGGLLSSALNHLFSRKLVIA